MKEEMILKRRLIQDVLDRSGCPLTSKEIEQRLRMGRRARLTTREIGSNLGVLRKQGHVNNFAVAVGLTKVGPSTYPELVHYWYSGSMTSEQRKAFRLKKLRGIEAKYSLMKRGRRAPITGDMRQMCEDIRNARHGV